MDPRNNSWLFLSVLFLFLFLFFSSRTHVAIAADTISVGQSLTGNQTIISKGGVFELGFFTPGKSLNYYIGIWFKKVTIQKGKVVWVANRDNPLSDPSSSELKLLDNGNLVILNQSQIPIWSTNLVSNTLSSSEVVLGDDGNLVLRDGSNPSVVLWQSFDNPTDTWLPGGKLGLDKRTNKMRRLTCWRNEEDPRPGIFSMELDQSGKDRYIIRWNRSEIFLTSRVLNGQVNSYNYVSNNDENYITYAVPGESTVFKILMDLSGQVKQLGWSEANQEWILYLSQPEQQCEVYGICGAFGCCNKKGSPFCNCLQGFEKRSSNDWDLSDSTGGCVRSTALQCGEKDVFSPLPRMKMPVSFQSLVVRSAEECKLACSNRCSCNAYAYNGSVGCSLWDGDLLNLQQLSDGDAGGRDLYLRFAVSNNGTSESKNNGTSESKNNGTSEGKKKKISKFIIIAPIISVGTIILCVIGCMCLLRRNKANQREKQKKERESSLFRRDDNYKESSDPNMLGDTPDIKFFKFEKLEIATNGFCKENMLGQGGFGPVYKGKFKDGQEIAVKRLSKSSGQGLAEFKTEVLVILKLQHRNLVGLLGCCIEGEEKMLIYEYMPNKSLDAFLFDSTKRALLDWRKRFQIIEGISRGILYLHRDSKLRVIHRDLKASNILLDKDLNPKISDFGIARIFGGNELQANTKTVVGTCGYMSPEYAMEGIFSEKSDVFSFGVLLLEIVSGKRNTSSYHEELQLSLLRYAWKLWNENKTRSLIDPTLLSEPNVEGEILRCIHVGLLCVQEVAMDRPIMATTLSMLTTESASLPTPKQPAVIERQVSSIPD